MLSIPFAAYNSISLKVNSPLRLDSVTAFTTFLYVAVPVPNLTSNLYGNSSGSHTYLSFPCASNHFFIRILFHRHYST